MTIFATQASVLASDAGLYSNIDNFLKCQSIEKVRCLEVQEYRSDFVGPMQDQIQEETIALIKEPSVRDLICCESDSVQKSVLINQIFEKSTSSLGLVDDQRMVISSDFVGPQQIEHRIKLLSQ